MDHADYGRYLGQQRELRGLSRDDVATRTKIPISVIAALEDGQVERLPGRVFVLNYIRAYAQVIGMSPEDAVLRYEEVDLSKTVPSPVTLERARRKHAWWVVLLMVLLGAVLAGGMYFLAQIDQQPDSVESR